MVIKTSNGSFVDEIEEGIITPLSSTSKKAAEKEAKKRRREALGCSFHDHRRELIYHQKEAR